MSQVNKDTLNDLIMRNKEAFKDFKNLYPPKFNIKVEKNK
jgi:hypothetical protein